MWAAALGTLGFGGYMMYINQQQSPMLAKEKVPGALDHHKQGPRPVEATHRAITDVTGEKVIRYFFSACLDGGLRKFYHVFWNKCL